MSFGKRKSITENEVTVNGTILETVTSFKFLGVIIAQDESFKEHLLKRRSMFMTGLGGVQRLGFKRRENENTPIHVYSKVQANLQANGMETIKINKSSIKKYLSTLEGNCLKI